MSFKPINDLEIALVNAATDASCRPEFYRILSQSNIFVLGETSANSDGMLGEGETISLQNVEFEGKLYISAFTSKEQLSQSVDRETSFVTLRFSDLIGFIGDSEIALNPGRDYGKILLNWEIAGMRDGSIWKPEDQMIIKKDTQVLLGHPSNPPKKLLENLSKYFSTRKEVEAAFNVHFFNPESDEKPHTLICVTARDNRELISSEIGIIARNSEVPDPPVDVMFIVRNDGFGKGIYADFKPFYKISKGIFFSIFGK